MKNSQDHLTCISCWSLNLWIEHLGGCWSHLLKCKNTGYEGDLGKESQEFFSDYFKFEVFLRHLNGDLDAFQSLRYKFGVIIQKMLDHL